MIIKFTEIYERKDLREAQSLSPFKKYYDIRDVYINPEHVVCLREDDNIRRILAENERTDNIDPDKTFTRLSLDRGQVGIDVVVMGNPSEVQTRLQKNGEMLLNG